MLLGIDHLVIAVRDPDAAAATIEARPRDRVHRRRPARRVGDVQPPRVPRRHLPRAHRRLRSSARGIVDGVRGGRARLPSSTRAARASRRSRSRPTTSPATSNASGPTGSPIALPVDGARTRPDGEIGALADGRGGHSARASRRSSSSTRAPAPSGATRRERPARRSATRLAVGSASRDSRSTARIRRRRRTGIERPSGSPSGHRRRRSRSAVGLAGRAAVRRRPTAGRSSISSATAGPNGSTSFAMGFGGDAPPDRRRPGHGPGRDWLRCRRPVGRHGGPDAPAVPTPVPGGPDISGPSAAAGAVGPTPAINPDRVGAAVPIGAGSAATGAWGAWAYRLKDGSMCLEYVGGARGRCGLRARAVHAQADDVDLGAGWLHLGRQRQANSRRCGHPLRRRLVDEGTAHRAR